MPQSIFQHKIINAGMLIFTGPCFLFALTNNCDNLLQVCMLLMLVPSCALKQIDLHSRHTVGADKTAGSTKAYTFACVLQRTLTDQSLYICLCFTENIDRWAVCSYRACKGGQDRPAHRHPWRSKSCGDPVLLFALQAYTLHY